MRLRPPTLVTPHRALVTAALLLSTLVGSLTGAIDLFAARALQHAAPIDHARSHALTQLFGFMWLLTMGVSLTLAPRLLGAKQGAPESLVRLLTRGGIVGVVLLIVGRLGRLVPGSSWLGLLGAAVVLAVAVRWAAFIISMKPQLRMPVDRLPVLVKTGAVWWVLASLLAFIWQLGQSAGGPISAWPLAPVFAAALWGATGAWLTGISFRAGACTMESPRPTLPRQTLAAVAVTTAAVAQTLSAFTLTPWANAIANLITGVAMLVLIFSAIRPPLLRRELLHFEEPQLGLAMRVGWAWASVGAVLLIWQALAVFWPTPPLLVDVTRHVFTIGWALHLVFGFAGRMVPGFEATSLQWPRVYNASLLLLSLAVLLRATSAFSTGGPALRAAGLSGPLAWLAIAGLASTLLATVREGRKQSSNDNPLRIVRVA